MSVDSSGDPPRPLDDGAAAHLVGTETPPVALEATTGHDLLLSDLAFAVIFCFPGIGHPDRQPPGGNDGWDAIPGARGCTPHACGYRDQHDAIRETGYEVVGMSTQSPADQQEAAERLGLRYPLVSDHNRLLADALRLPTFTVDGDVFLRRLTWIQEAGRIVHLRYPVAPPETDASAVLHWIRTSGAGSAGDPID